MLCLNIPIVIRYKNCEPKNGPKLDRTKLLKLFPIVSTYLHQSKEWDNDRFVLVAVTFIKTATAIACQSPIQAWGISSSICISALDLLHMYKTSSFHVCTCVQLITSSTILFIVLQIYWKKPLVPNFLIFLWNEKHFFEIWLGTRLSRATLGIVSDSQ